MNTLLARQTTASTDLTLEPANPVDEALWGLADRLSAAFDAEDQRAGSLTAAESRLPKRSPGLPSAGRLARTSTPTSSKSGRKPTIDDALPTGVVESATLGRVQFTILKRIREQESHASPFQGRPTSGEHTAGAKVVRQRKKRRSRGLSLAGWSLMVVGAAVAAAIALWAPAWL